VANTSGAAELEVAELQDLDDAGLAVGEEVVAAERDREREGAGGEEDAAADLPAGGRGVLGQAGRVGRVMVDGGGPDAGAEPGPLAGGPARSRPRAAGG
jgi:hypothetical protein